MSCNYLDIELMEKMCHRLAVAVFDTNEDPIAEFRDHELPLLDSALKSPQQTFDGKELYPTIEEKAAILYYSLNKNHPFRNGNKRIATASLLVFLFMNNSWLQVPREELLEKTLDIAKSEAESKDKILAELKIWIKEHLIKQ